MCEQICTAPDYVLIPRAAQDEFVNKLQEVCVFRTSVAIHILSAYADYRYKSFYSEDVSESDSYTRIVSQAHAARIKRYIDNTRGKVVIGGQVDVEKRFVAPTVIKDVPFDDSTMEEYVLLPLGLIVAHHDPGRYLVLFYQSFLSTISTKLSNSSIPSQFPALQSSLFLYSFSPKGTSVVPLRVHQGFRTESESLQ